MFAAEGNPNPDVISTLLKAGAGIDSTISDGRTALMLAAQFNQNPEIVTALLRAGANGKLKSKAGNRDLRSGGGFRLSIPGRLGVDLARDLRSCRTPSSARAGHPDSPEMGGQLQVITVRWK